MKSEVTLSKLWKTNELRHITIAIALLPFFNRDHLRAGDLIAGTMVIAMPSDGLLRDGSGYLDWPGAENVERWIVDEVPAVAALAAPALSAQAPVAIGGLSMGGYGALRLGAKYADRFCAISAHSAITEISEFAQFVDIIGEDTSGARINLRQYLHHSADFHQIQHWLYPDEILRDPAACVRRAFLTPLNIDVDKFNADILERLPGPICEFVY